MGWARRVVVTFGTPAGIGRPTTLARDSELTNQLRRQRSTSRTSTHQCR